MPCCAHTADRLVSVDVSNVLLTHNMYDITAARQIVKFASERSQSQSAVVLFHSSDKHEVSLLQLQCKHSITAV